MTLFGVAPAIDIATLLRLDVCTVLPAAARLAETTNATVRSAPPMLTSDVFGHGRTHVTASLVEVTGPTDESPHYHTSHLVGTVVAGTGWLRTTNAECEVAVGDVIVIPRGVLHIFEARSDKPMSYIAYEVSDAPIDYQKHFHD